MADEINSPDNPDETGDEAPSRSWLRIVLLLVGLSLGGTVGVLFAGPMVGGMLSGGGEGGGGGGHGGGHGAPAETLHVIDNVVVNPSGTQGRRFLLVSVALEPADGDVDHVEALEPRIRAALIPILGNRTVEQLLDLGLRQELLDEVSSALDEIVGGEGLRHVMFPQFVVQ